ncbi:MAG: hypothetical protein GY858_09960 [Candidatus Omnitrophica bacterium]|nr:hypothetical protein [Candidatus Omnitrophota bacterium]
MKEIKEETQRDAVLVPTVIKPNGNILLSYQLQIDSLKGTIGALQEEREDLAGKLETANNLVSTLSEEADVQKYEALVQESKERAGKSKVLMERLDKVQIELGSLKTENQSLQEKNLFQSVQLVDVAKERTSLQKEKKELLEQVETKTELCKKITEEKRGLQRQREIQTENYLQNETEWEEDKKRKLGLTSLYFDKIGELEEELKELREAFNFQAGEAGQRENGYFCRILKLEKENKELAKEVVEINREKEELKEKESNLEELRIKQEKELNKNKADLKELGEQTKLLKAELEKRKNPGQKRKKFKGFLKKASKWFGF